MCTDCEGTDIIEYRSGRFACLVFSLRLGNVSLIVNKSIAAAHTFQYFTEGSGKLPPSFSKPGLDADKSWTHSAMPLNPRPNS
jgi:hypothetical protein